MNLYRIEITLDIYAGSESEALAKAYLCTGQPYGARMIFDVDPPELVAEHVDDPGSPENRAKRNAEVRERRAGRVQLAIGPGVDPPVAVFPRGQMWCAVFDCPCRHPGVCGPVNCAGTAP